MKTSVKQAIKIGLKFIDENAPTILMIVSLIGLGGSVACAIHDAPIAKEKIREKKVEKLADKEDRDKLEIIDIYEPDAIDDEKLTPWEYFQVLAPVYWRTAVCVTATGVCIFFTHHIEHKRYLAALGLLALKEKDLEKYKAKVKELFGDKKSEQVENELAKDIINGAPKDDENVHFTIYGSQLFYDTASNSWFRSSLDAVKRGINEFNAQLIRDGEASVDDLCYHYGYDVMACCNLNREYWRYEDFGHEHYDILSPKFTFSGHPLTQEPCTVISYNRYPDFRQ